MKVTAAILTRDRPRMLPATLKSVSFLDEVLVISSGPKEVNDIAHDHGATVIQATRVNRHEGGYSGLRNLALRNATYPWAFFLDDDETCNPEALQSALRNAAPNLCWGAFPRYNMRRPWDYWPGEYPDWQVRLVHREMRYHGLVHESVGGVNGTYSKVGAKFPLHIFHWGWATRYTMRTRITSYAAVGSQATSTEDVEVDWRALALKATRPVPESDCATVPIPEPVAEEWPTQEARP